MLNRIGLVALFLAIASGPAAAAAPNEAAGKQLKAESGKLYCFALEGTGSRMAKRECRTKAEWARMGVEVKVPDKV